MLIDQAELKQLREDAAALRERGLAYLEALDLQVETMLEAAETRDNLNRTVELARARFETSKAAVAALEELELIL